MSPRRPNRWTLILRAQRIRRLTAELAQSAGEAQLTPAEVNIIASASRALYQVEFILSTTARRARNGRPFAQRLPAGTRFSNDNGNPVA